MPTIAIIDISSGTIETFYENDVPDQSQFGGPWGWSYMTIHVSVPINMDKDIIKAVKQEDGTYIFEVDPEKEAEKTSKKWGAIRSERNYRLNKSDWTQLLDTNLTTEQRDKWVIYRKQLRDLPQNITDLNDIPWPVQPID